MKAPTINFDATGILVLVGVAVAGFVAWKVYRTGQAVTEAVGETFEKAKQTAIEVIDFLPKQFNIAAANAPRMEELTFDEMGNVIGSKTSETAQAGYARPPNTSSGNRERDPAGTLSFFQPGASFKDLSDPLGVNPFARLYNFQQP